MRDGFASSSAYGKYQQAFTRWSNYLTPALNSGLHVMNTLVILGVQSIRLLLQDLWDYVRTQLTACNYQGRQRKDLRPDKSCRESSHHIC